MIPADILNGLSKEGWSDTTLLEVDRFLAASNGVFEFHNLANIGGGDFRLMYKEKVGVDAKGNPITKMQCKLGAITYDNPKSVCCETK